MTKQFKKHLTLILAFALAFSSVVPATLHAKENTEVTLVYLNKVNNTYVGVKFFDGNNKHLINSKLLVKNNKFDTEFMKDYPLKSTKLDGDKVNIILEETNPERLVNFIMLVEKHNAELSEMEALNKLNEIIRNEEFYEEDTIETPKDKEETNPIVEDNKDDKKEPAEEPKETEKPIEDNKDEDKKTEKPVEDDKKDDDKSESESIYDKIKKKLQEQKENEIKELLEGLIANIKTREEAEKASQELYDKIKDNLNQEDASELKEKIKELLVKVENREEAKKASEDLYKNIKANLKEEDLDSLKDTIIDLIKATKEREKANKESEDLYNKIKAALDQPDNTELKKTLEDLMKNVETREEAEKASKELYEQIKEKLNPEDINKLKTTIEELIKEVEKRENDKKESEDLYDKIKEKLNPENADKLKETIEELIKNIKTREEAEKVSKELYEKIKDKLNPEDLTKVKATIEELIKAVEDREQAKKASEDLYDKIKEKLNPENTDKLKETIEELIKNIETREEAEKVSKELYEKIKDKLNPEDLSKVKGTIEELIKAVEDRKQAKKVSEDLYNQIKDALKDNDKDVEAVKKTILELQENIKERETEPRPLTNDEANDIIIHVKELLKQDKVDEVNEYIAGLKLNKLDKALIDKLVEAAIEDYKEKKNHDTEEPQPRPDVPGDDNDDNPQEPEAPVEETIEQRFNKQKGIDFNLMRHKFLDLINEERTSHGLDPLELADYMQKGTETRAQELADWGHIRTGENYDQKHARLNGDNFRTAFDYLPLYEAYKAGYLGENLAGSWFHKDRPRLDGKPADESLFNEDTVANFFFTMWKNSKGHYDNFMDPRYKTMWFEVRVGKPITSGMEINGDSMNGYQLVAGVQILSLKSAAEIEEDKKYYYKDGILYPIEEKPEEPVDGENAAKKDLEEPKEEAAEKPVVEEDVKDAEKKEQTTVENPKDGEAENADKPEEK